MGCGMDSEYIDLNNSALDGAHNIIDDLRSRAESAEETVAGLRTVLEEVTGPYSGSAYNALEDEYVFERLTSALSATPAQHAARIKERVLREAAERAEKETEDEKGEDSSFFYGIVTADTLREWADEAAKEAGNA